MGQPVTPLRVGIIGCGQIAAQYLDTFARLDSVALIALADLIPERATDLAAQVPGARALSIDELLADPDVQFVLNLTIPAAHAEVTMRALAAGKEVYTEKPLTPERESASAVLAASRLAGLWVGCAPDTVLGTGVQTARAAIDDGVIGRPIAATATMVTPGHERWHPNPDFYYLPGGGPLLDMGPYYVTALVHLLGPIVSVIGSASRMRDERTIGTGSRAGHNVPVQIDTHVSGVLRHASGALSTIVMSFDAVATHSSNIEVHGERGTVAVPDPNHFDGQVSLHALGGDGWIGLPPSAGYVDAGRGIGIHDRVVSDTPRASAELGFHVLDVMQSLLQSAAEGHAVAIESTCERPVAVPLTTI